MKEMSRRERARVLGYLEERFGLRVEGRLFIGRKGRVFLSPNKPIIREVSHGLQIARLGSGVKPSTSLFHLFWKQVKKSVVRAGREQAIAFAAGENVPGKGSEGYVLVAYQRLPLGCGLLRGGEVKNMVPKAKRLDIRFI